MSASVQMLVPAPERFRSEGVKIRSDGAAEEPLKCLTAIPQMDH
jgi:hypothetical protein